MGLAKFTMKDPFGPSAIFEEPDSLPSELEGVLDKSVNADIEAAVENEHNHINKPLVEDEFLSLFDSLIRQKTPLVITKAHQGIILQHKINTLFVDNQRVVFEIDVPPICAALEGRVQLHCQLFSRPVKARVIDLSLSKGMFSLSGFSYMKKPWTDRLHERVQPSNPIYVCMRYQGKDIRASLSDLSNNGAGLLVGKPESRELRFETNSCVDIDFQISRAYKWEKLGGAIHYQQFVTSSMLRLGIRLYPKLEQSHYLDSYIIERKAEIMDHLEQIYYASSIPSGVENQYF
ncbi:MAG: hypothetical protein AB8I56_19385 [Anaerolineales bacterium]|jgi:hypothetical protein